MMRHSRFRTLWGAVGLVTLAAGAWALYRMKERPETKSPAEQPATGTDSPAAVSTESRAEEDVTTVWWTKNGKTYHQSRDCVALKRSAPESIYSGTRAQACQSGKDMPCGLCFGTIVG